MDLNQSLLFKLRPRNLVRASLRFLPKEKRHRIYRDMIRLDLAPPPELKLCLAKSKEELEAAFRILHDEYVRAGFMRPHPTGLRLTSYHALPSTSVLIAKWNDEVVGTVSIVRSSPFGFPLDKIFDTSHLKQNGARLAEISALAIRQDFRQNRGAILYPLTKFVYEYCKNYFGVNYMVIAVNPAHIEFYESILAFDLLQGEVKSYDFVEGAPAVGGVLDMRTGYARFAAQYGDKSNDRSIFHYFHEFQHNAFQYPDRPFYNISDPTMSPELLDYFFNTKTRLFSGLSEHERAVICSLYNYEEYKSVLPECDLKDSFYLARRQVRHDVECHGRIILSEKRIVKMVVMDVSRSGFRARLAEPIRFGARTKINIAIADFEIADLTGWPVWRDEHNLFGFQIEDATGNWARFIDHLDSHQAQREYSAAS